MRITESDITNHYCSFHSGWTSFLIPNITESILNSDKAADLEDFVASKGFNADLFNTEYMGFLTGSCSISANEISKLVKIINEFLKNLSNEND